MKTLTLIRHAKSSWENDSLRDFDRPLNDRGKHDAPMMAKRLSQKGLMPDIMLSSPAKRAKKTALIMADIIGYDTDEILFDDRLYLAGIAELIYFILEHNNGADHIMMFGHNPGITEFSNFLAACDIVNVPTCGIITIQFDMDSWETIESTKGNLVSFDYPKNND